MKYDIWMEGFSEQGMEGRTESARLMATIEADSFEDACKKYVSTMDKMSQRLYDKRNNTLWGCKFYDNEKDARKLFG